MKLRQAICKELKIIRANKQIMQKEVSYELDISRSTFTHLENGDKNLSIDKLETWASSLGYELTFKLTKK